MFKIFYTRDEALKTFLNCHTLSGYSYSKLYKKTVLEELFFPEDMSFGEDGVFGLRAYNKAGAGVSFSPRPIYNYRIRKGSLSGHGEEFSKKDLEIIKQIEYAKDCLESEEYKKDLNIFEFLSYSGILLKYEKSSDVIQEMFKKDFIKMRDACNACWKDCFFYAVNPKYRIKALKYGIKMVTCRY